MDSSHGRKGYIHMHNCSVEMKVGALFVNDQTKTRIYNHMENHLMQKTCPHWLTTTNPFTWEAKLDIHCKYVPTSFEPCKHVKISTLSSIFDECKHVE